MAKRNLNDIAVNATTLNSIAEKNFVRYHNPYQTDPDESIIMKFMGYQYNVSRTWNSVGPSFGFGTTNYYCLINVDNNKNQIFYSTTLNGNKRGWLRLLTEEDINQVITLSDLNDILSDEQIEKIETKVSERIELKNKNMTQLTDNQQIGGGKAKITQRFCHYRRFQERRVA